MSTPAGWDPIQTPKHRAGADAFHLSPFARLARAHVLVAAGDALRHHRAGQLALLRPRPQRRPVEGLPLPRADDGTARPRGPVHRPGARPLGRRAALDDRGRERGPCARVPRDDRRPRRAAAVPGGVRGAGHGQGLRASPGAPSCRPSCAATASSWRPTPSSSCSPASPSPSSRSRRGSRSRSPGPRACWSWPSSPTPRPPSRRCASRAPRWPPRPPPRRSRPSSAAPASSSPRRRWASCAGSSGFLTFLLLFQLRDGDTWKLGAVLLLTGRGRAARVGGRAGAAALVPRGAHAHDACSRSAVVGGLAAAWIGGLAASMLLAGIVAVVSTAGRLAFDSLVQRDAPDANRGRSFAALRAPVPDRVGGGRSRSPC